MKNLCYFQFLGECDEVLYLKDGEISERGTHMELAAMGGGYSHMLSYEQDRDQKDDSKEHSYTAANLQEELPSC